MLLYHVEGLRLNDSWYCKSGDTYHAFFLQCKESGAPQSVGHACSRDLFHWEYAGAVLSPDPDGWNDESVATGSVAEYNGKWYMLYSGISSDPAKGGIGLAVSDDLMTWTRAGDGPVIPIRKLASLTSKASRNEDGPFPVTQYGIGYPFTWEGDVVRCTPLADPYIYPEPVDGEYYIFVNSHALGRPINERGTIAVFKTRDFRSFTPDRIAVLDCCDRLETPQVWKHGDRYYMYVGRVWSKTDETGRIIGQDNQNWLFQASAFTGPYTPLQRMYFRREVEGSGPYIAKVLTDPNGREVMIVNHIPAGGAGPYPVSYLPDGTVELDYDV